MQCAQMALLHSLHLKMQAMMRSPMHVREEVVGGPGHRERLLLSRCEPLYTRMTPWTISNSKWLGSWGDHPKGLASSWETLATSSHGPIASGDSAGLNSHLSLHGRAAFLRPF